jgi:hypothetical protein
MLKIKFEWLKKIIIVEELTRVTIIDITICYHSKGYYH